MNNYGVKGGAIANCNGIIRNNVISHNTGEKCFVYRPPVSGGSYWIPGVGGAFYNCQASILNNTIADNYLDNGNGLIAGGFSKCTGPITNNIIYHTTMTTTLEYDQCSTPTYCLFRAPRAGQGNISGDPLFVNPAQGDYHLQSGSPAIGAGQAINGVKADLDGHQRGLNMITGRGDGSGMDIGAYEALPRPVAVWLQNGAPDQLAEGQQLAVGWQMDLTTGGTAIDLRLVQGGMVVKDYGKFWNPGGADITTITLPKPLISLADYRIEGRSSYDMSLTFDTPPFAIQGSGKSAAGLVWSQYL